MASKVQSASFSLYGRGVKIAIGQQFGVEYKLKLAL